MKLPNLLALFCVPVLVARMTPAPAPIADAAMHGDVETVRKLIKQGANVNAAQGDGMTALHWAAERGDEALVNAILQAHPNLKAVTRIGGYTPLHIASKTGNAAIIEALVKGGSDVKAVTSTGATAIHFAAQAGNPAAISALVKAGADVNARETQWGQTPLIFAAEYDRADAIRALIKAGADPSIHTTVLNLKDQAAREQAATRKRNAVLISWEPKKDSAAKHDSAMKAGIVPADSAASAAPAAPAPTGGRAGRRMAIAAPAASMTPLDSAVAASAPAAAAPGAAAAAGGGRGGRGGPLPKGPFTPAQVQAAIDSGRAVYMKPAEKNAVVVEKVDSTNGVVASYDGGVGGLTALHHAVRQGNIAAVVALLDGGAPINDTSYVDHSTPLLMAAINGQWDVAMKLIERGADVNMSTKIGMSPLYATINTQWSPKSRYPQPQALQVQSASYIDVMEALLKKGADANAKITGPDPFYYAYNYCGNANCGLEGLTGSAPFWRAAYAVDLDAMKLLVKYHADYNAPEIKPAGRGGRGGGGGGGGGGRGGAGGAAGAGGADAQAAAAAAFAPPPVKNLPEIDSLSKIAPVGLGTFPIDAVAGVGYGNGFAGNSHRHAPDGWMPAMRYMVEVLHADVNQPDQQGFTPLHHAAARGDNDMILYLVAHGANVKAVSRTGRTVVDMANGPVQRLVPLPETIALLEKLGAVNQHHCVSC